MKTHSEELTGFDLVNSVLHHPKGGVDALLRLAGEGETEWLEFKAAMVGRPEDRKGNENEADGHWHVAEAVVAMANTKGGVVLVGVDDDGQAVGLAAGDLRRVIAKSGLEGYLRQEIHNRLQPPKGSVQWKTGNKGVWAIPDGWPTESFRVSSFLHQEQTIAAILVKPVSCRAECIYATQNDEERLLKRSAGNVGQVETLRGRRAMQSWESERNPVDSMFTALWKRFLDSTTDEATEDKDLEASITAWHQLFRKNSADLEAFTSLDAAEILDENNTDEPSGKIALSAFEPEAIETLPSFVTEDFDCDFIDYEDEDDGDDLSDREDEEGNEGCDTDRSARRGGLFALLAEEPRALLVGEPGGGKTTALRRLTLESIERYQPGGPVTLFIPLGQWLKSGGLWQLFRQKTGLARTQVRSLLRKGRCRLLLDALNECPDNLRSVAVAGIRDLLEEYPNTPLVISARNAETANTFGLPVFSVEALSEAKQQEFLVAYLNDAERATATLERLRSQPGGCLLAANPLLLRMIVDVAREQEDLPEGRAGLYRKWIQHWYEREVIKARKASDSLPWSTEEAVRGFAAIALAARKEGMRIADDDLALESLAKEIDQPALFLERMTQGPLVVREEGTLRFRHETFQEYFCAEALLWDPNALEGVGSGCKSTWAMPLAYAAELQQPLMQPLLQAVWSIDPWLAAIIDYQGDARIPLGEPTDELMDWLLRGEIPPNLGRLLLNYDVWYRAENSLRYALTLSADVKAKWREFELSQLKFAKHVSDACAIIRRSLVLSGSCEIMELRNAAANRADRNKWIAQASPRQAVTLIESGLIYREDLEARFEELTAISTPDQAISWIRNDLMRAEDFKDRFEEWADQSTPGQAVHWIRMGLMRTEDFKGSFRRLGNQATSDEAIKWIKTDLMRTEDFKGRAEEWATQETIENAITLVQSGLMKPEDFERRLGGWAAEATIEQAVALIQSGLTRAEDFKGRFEGLGAVANPGQAITLMQAGLMSRSVFEGRFEELVAEANFVQAVNLIRTGLMSEKVFKGRFEGWAAKTNPDQAMKWIETGLMSREEFKGRFEGLAAQASPSQAIQWIQSGLMSREDFKGRFQEWVAKATPSQARKWIESGLMSRYDFKTRFQGVVAKATPYQAMNWTQSGSMSREDFKGRFVEWVAKATPKHAIRWIQSGLMNGMDFKGHFEEWAAKATPSQAKKMIESGLMSVEDFKFRFEELSAQAPPTQAISWIQTGLMSEEDFQGRLVQWAAQVNPQQAISLIKSGIMRETDFKGRVEEWTDEVDPGQAIVLIKWGLLSEEDLAGHSKDWSEPLLQKLKMALEESARSKSID